MGPITAADIILFVTHSKKQQGLSLTTIIHTNKQKTQNFNKVGIAPFLWLSIPLFLRLLPTPNIRTTHPHHFATLSSNIQRIYDAKVDKT
jgi:hypothetical protein